MLALCIDTSYKILSVSLIEDGKLIAYEEKECFKRQSEEVFCFIDKLNKENNNRIYDIDSICVAKGPGSYTGIRIAMTIAKVIATVKHIDLYTISTLALYAGNKDKTLVLINARADRAYVGIYDKGQAIQEDNVLALDNIKADGFNIIGDGSFIGKEDHYECIAKCFEATFNSWHKEENPDYLVPDYLKESKSYLK